MKKVLVVEDDREIHRLICEYLETQNYKTVSAENGFEPFYRIDSPTNNGAGPGLYVVKILAEKLGISVNADLNINGVFSIEMKF